MLTLTFDLSNASGLNRMSAVQRSKRPSMAEPPQAVAKPRVEPALTFQADGAAASAGVSAAGAVSTATGAAVGGVSTGASSTTGGGGGSGLLAGGAGRTA